MADIYTTHMNPLNHRSCDYAAKPQQAPCKYRAGRELGRGTYAVVKEMEHIDTGQWYAGKIISKKLMAGHEASIGNELRILRLLQQHQYSSSVLALKDYFETAHNVYLITELCSGGELFDRIRNRSIRNEATCIRLVRQLVEGVCHLHGLGIVHRDLKPENCLLRNKDTDDLAIVDFGMARILDSRLLTSLCGTPGYMAPEMVLRSGHGRPVDMWAVGVIALFLLTGHNPFQGAGQKHVLTTHGLRALLDHVWRRTSPHSVSVAAREFVESLLRFDPETRMTAEQALVHPWLMQTCCWYPSPVASPQMCAVSDYGFVKSADAAVGCGATGRKRRQPDDFLAMYLEAAEAAKEAATAAPAYGCWLPLSPPGTLGSNGTATNPVFSRENSTRSSWSPKRSRVE
ncbi:Calcium/calmodulin-dependent protein kinase type I [Coemansia sp. IMI 203386]|nr:Calcium/calmodulin-dependent protein kinase type I [Coemansia sp. IMI 203386]